MSDAWWITKDVVNVMDVLEQGACIEGVVKYVTRTRRIAGPPIDDSEYGVRLSRAANLGGYGYRNGYGYGDGYGYGHDNGNGYGDSYGDGNGNGYGSGNDCV